MLSTEMKERKEGKVEIEGICSEAVKEMVASMYGKIPNEEMDVNVMCDLFRAAHMLVFNDVQFVVLV